MKKLMIFLLFLSFVNIKAAQKHGNKPVTAHEIKTKEESEAIYKKYKALFVSVINSLTMCLENEDKYPDEIYKVVDNWIDSASRTMSYVQIFDTFDDNMILFLEDKEFVDNFKSKLAADFPEKFGSLFYDRLSKIGLAQPMVNLSRTVQI